MKHTHTDEAKHFAPEACGDPDSLNSMASGAKKFTLL